MAATEKRNGVSRRGMTVLGKVPIVPKPINLPSQRSTFCWGRFPNGGGLSGKIESALVDPVSSEDRDGLDLKEKKVQPSGTNSATTTTMGSDNGQKMEGTNTSVTHTENGKQKITGPSIQKGGDVAFLPPGFSPSGLKNSPKSRVPSTDSQCNDVASGLHSEKQQSGSQNHSSGKDREIIVIHMVGAPGFYGNFPPHFGSPESHNMNGVSANMPLQFGNFEPFFGFQGHGVQQLPIAPGSEHHDGHEGYICYEKECLKGACHDVGRQRNTWMHGSSRDNSFVGGFQGEALHPLMARSLSHRHLSRNVGRPRTYYQNGRVVAMEETNCEPMSRNRIMLLTKLSQHGVQAQNSLNKDAEFSPGHVASSYLNAELYDDEGKAPIEVLEDRKVDKVKAEPTLPAEGVSMNLEMTGEETCPKETEAETMKVSSSKITCNDKCLHCKGTAVTGCSPTSLCHSCEKTTVCESRFSSSQPSLDSTEEVPVSAAEKDSSADGCKADVKHIILDADNHINVTVKSGAASQQQDNLIENDKCSVVSELSNSEVVEMGSDVLSGASLTKCEKPQKVVSTKKWQLKQTSKPVIRVSRAHVKTKMSGSQGTKPISVISSTSSSNCEETSEVLKTEQENGVQKVNPLLTPALSLSNDSQKSMTAVVLVNEKSERPRKFVYRKKLSELAANGQLRKEESKTTQTGVSLPAVVQKEIEIEHVEDRVKSISSAPSFEYPMIQRRVNHVVEGSEDHFLSSKTPVPCDNKDKKQPEKVEGRKLPTTETSSLHSATESPLLQQSAVQIKPKDSFTSDTADAVKCGLQPLRISSGTSQQEDHVTKKFCRQLSAWRPKLCCQPANSGNSIIEKEKETGSSTSALIGADEEDINLSATGPIGDLNAVHLNAEEQHSSGNIQHDFCLELECISHGVAQCAENNQLSNHLGESFVQGDLENVSFSPKGVSESMKPGELPLCSPGISNLEGDSTPNDKEAGRQEILGCHKPFVKKTPMSREEADRYHQILFKRYKEIGKWRPKANAHKKSIKKKESIGLNQDDTKSRG